MSIAFRLRALLALVVAFSISPVVAAASPWSESASAPLAASGPQPANYRTFDLDIAAVRAQLAAAQRQGVATDLALPLPEGGAATFTLADSGTMPSALRQKYPDIVSLAGADAHGRRARVDVSPAGLSAMVFDDGGRYVIVPRTSGAGYLVFRGASLPPRSEPFRCGLSAPVRSPLVAATRAGIVPATVTGAARRNYRIAVAANASYVETVGNGTVAGGLAAVVAAMNRVNEVYETELAVHMTLVANNDLLIYADAASDPYSNDENALYENGPNLDATIGATAYDIGHVFTTAGGGIAGLGVTCTESKGMGTTGRPDPTGDPFWIDYVAHEIGHQFNGMHTFNGCSNDAYGSEYEPGSGSTIQAYAGICGADNLQPNSDPYFHARSLEEMTNWIDGTGGECVEATPNTNRAPVIDVSSLPPAGTTIPAQTAFALTASATDPDGDALTYGFEQYDVGEPSFIGAGDIGNGPIFRSFPATADPTRYFPRLSTLLGGEAAIGEDLPTTTRGLTFRLTVRDNRAQGGRSTSADVDLAVTAAAGPFEVTLPDSSMAWGRGETRHVRWNVARTDLAPVSCAAVDVALSTDGGASFAHALATQVPNTGHALIVVPNVPNTVFGRVRVKCSNNVFLDISNENFVIAATGSADPVIDAIFRDGFQ
jgi:hypothetical protein